MGLWQYRLWSFTFGLTKSNRLEPKIYIKIYQRILWKTSLFGKSLLDFVSPNVKLHNRYCHSPSHASFNGQKNVSLPTASS